MRGCVSGLVLALTWVMGASQAQALDLTGWKGLGGSGGTSLVLGDYQFRTHARPRLTGDAVFRWGWSPDWTFVGMFGFGWNSYGHEEHWLSDLDLLSELGYPREVIEKVTTLAPFTGGVERRFGTGDSVPYVGAGGGLYMQQVLFNRSVGRDPRNGARYRTINPGIYGRVGLERFVSDKVSVDYDLLYHIVFSEDRETFPDPNSADVRRLGRDFRTYGGDSQTMQARIGIRYYWGGDQ